MKNTKYAKLTFLSISAGTILAGCAAAPAPPQIVKVPVYVSCVKTSPIRPQYEFSSLTLAATDGDKILALARDWPAARVYEGELEAVIAGCR